MDYIRINRIHEKDFDSIIEEAGGNRIKTNGSASNGYSADYRLNEAIIELKFIREEGLVKESRRRKVAEIFRGTQADRPVVVLDPKILSEKNLRKYYNLLGQPIQTAVKKAAKQVHETKLRIGTDSTRVLVILNDGYTALSMDEFREVVGKVVRNDTSKIDYAIAGGVYYYSDRFDTYSFARFDLIAVNVDKPFPSYNGLLDTWNRWFEKHMKSVIVGQENAHDDRFPVIDLNFEIDGIVYVKPCPPMGKPSSFWPSGRRPRENTTGIDACPPVATCFPKLSKTNWCMFKEAMPNESKLQDDYASWLRWAKEQEQKGGNKFQPFVGIDIEYEDCISCYRQEGEKLSFSNLCCVASEIFNIKIRSIIDGAINKLESSIVLPTYIFLLTEEIGKDKAFDISSIYYFNETPGFERDDIIVANERLFFEYALALASAYAVSMDLEAVVYEKNERYAWM
ncbi:MAG: hypothetical protein CEE38_14810 [Planctomycetes bacterium B3_Pla]|nr:MAG: hypothetical protein CEE38_14810 [Planctomycetes bacterium B3_Pla]